MTQAKKENYGLFIGDFLKYEPNLSPAQQAEHVLNYLRDYTKGQVGLIYSATNNQAIKIHQERKNQTKKLPRISGNGQAKLFGAITKLLNHNPDYKNLADRVHIFPLATSLKGGNNKFGNQVSKREMDRDLNAINEAVNNGYSIYGIPDPTEDNKSFAIGGGSSKLWKTKHFAALNGLTQNEYVQAELKEIMVNPQLKKVRFWEPKIHYDRIPKEFLIKDNLTLQNFIPEVEFLEKTIKTAYNDGIINDELAYEVLKAAEELAIDPNEKTLHCFNKCKCFECYCKHCES